MTENSGPSWKSNLRNKWWWLRGLIALLAVASADHVLENPPLGRFLVAILLITVAAMLLNDQPGGRPPTSCSQTAPTRRDMPDHVPAATWPENDQEHADFADWQYEVACGDTVLGYRDWVAHRDEALAEDL